MRREHNERMQQAWLTAFLPHQKRPPKFESLIYREAKPKQAWQEQQTIMNQWVERTKHLPPRRKLN